VFFAGFIASLLHGDEAFETAVYKMLVAENLDSVRTAFVGEQKKSANWRSNCRQGLQLLTLKLCQ
jgi:hypothetical protein